VLQTHKQRGDSTHKVEQHRGARAGERYAGGRVHQATSTVQTSTTFSHFHRTIIPTGQTSATALRYSCLF